MAGRCNFISTISPPPSRRLRKGKDVHTVASRLVFALERPQLVDILLHQPAALIVKVNHLSAAMCGVPCKASTLLASHYIFAHFSHSSSVQCQCATGCRNGALICWVAGQDDCRVHVTTRKPAMPDVQPDAVCSTSLDQSTVQNILWRSCADVTALMIWLRMI